MGADDNIKSERRLSTAPTDRPGQEGGKRDSNRRRRIADLLSAASDRFLKQGVEATTIAEITSDAKTAKGSFYRYFRDKEELVEALFAPLADLAEEAFAEAEKNLANATNEAQITLAYNILGMRLVPGILEHRELVCLYLQESRGAPSDSRRPIEQLRERIDHAALQLTEAAHIHGLWRPLPAEVSAFAVVGAVEKSLYSILTSNKEVDPAAWTSSLVSLILDGLSPRS